MIDTVYDKLIATIPNIPGLHGIAIANDLSKGFISYGTPGSVMIFDLATLKATGPAATGRNPDAISYEPVRRRVTFNDRSNDATIIDARNGEVIALSVPLGGKPAFSPADGPAGGRRRALPLPDTFNVVVLKT